MSAGNTNRVRQVNGLAVIATGVYINQQAAEEIAKICNGLIDTGTKHILLNLESTKLVNSIGISVLIEIIEKMMDMGGALAFSNLTPTIDKTLNIMGLKQYAKIFTDEASAVAALAKSRPE